MLYVLQAADFFRMKIRHVPVDPVTCKVDIRKMRKAINKNTCLVRTVKFL